MIFLDDAVCGGSGTLQILKFVFLLLDVVLFIVPILLVVMLTIDFVMAAIANLFPVKFWNIIFRSNQENGGSGGNTNGESWTNSQHFFAILGYNESNNTVYVSNPGRKDLNDQNGWINVDELTKCAIVNYLID